MATLAEMDLSPQSSQFNEEHEIQKSRKLVNDAIVQTFLSINSKSNSNEESLLTVVKFIRHCMHSSPQVFVTPKSFKLDISYVFTNWLLKQICILIGLMKTENLRKAFVQLLSSLFQLINDNSIHHHSLLFQELIFFLKRLARSHPEDQSDKKIIVSTHDERINTNDLDLSENQLKLSSINSFSSFQYHFISLLEKLAESNVMSLIQVQETWRTLFLFYDCESIELKQAVLRGTVNLFLNYGFPTTSTDTRRFIRLILQTFNLVVSSDYNQRNTCFNKLVSTLSSAVHCIFDVSRNDDELFELPTSETKYLFRQNLLIFKKLDCDKQHEILLLALHLNYYVISLSRSANIINNSEISELLEVLQPFTGLYDDEIISETITKCIIISNNSCLNFLSIPLLLEELNENQGRNISSFQKRLNIALDTVNLLECSVDVDPDIVHQIFPSESLDEIFKIWSGILSDDFLCTDLFPSIIRSIFSFLLTSHGKNLSTRIIENLITILIIPWNNQTPSEIQLDVVFASPENVRQETKRLIILCLSYLHYPSLSKWKCQFFSHLLQVEPDLGNVIGQSLPYLLHYKECTFETVCSWLKVFDKTLFDAKVFQYLVCAAAGNVGVISEKRRKNLHCKECDANCHGLSLVNTEFCIAIYGHIRYLKDNHRAIKSLYRILHHADDRKQIFELCLSLLEDPDFDVRMQYANQLSMMMVKDLTAGDYVLQNFDRFKICYENACSSDNVRLQETVLKTVGIVAKHLPLSKIKDFLVMLVHPILVTNTTPSITAVARIEFHDLCLSYKISAKELCYELKEPLCKFLCQALIKVCKDDCTPEAIVSEFAVLFEFSNLRSCLSSILRYILPVLVSQISVVSSQILKWVTKVTNKHYRELFMDYLNFIFCYLVCRCSHEQCENALRYIQEKSGVQIESLLRAEFQHVLNELIFYLGSHYDQVFSGLFMLASRSDHNKSTLKMGDRIEMARFLQPRLLGFLTYFDSQLLQSKVRIDQKWQTLQSLQALIRLMGPECITPVRMKVMATLRIALNFKDGGLPEICCKVWFEFVRNLEISALSSMLNQILATLLPLAKILPLDVAAIYRYLIVERRDELKDNFCDLYIVPDPPEFDDVRKALAESSQSVSIEFISLIKHAIKGIGHESNLVRGHALNKLRKILQQNQYKLNECVLGTDNVDEIISELISTLINACKDSDSEVLKLITECLGEVGAIDPGRLTINQSNTKKDMAKIRCSVNEDNFAFDLISELARAFLSAKDTRTQNCSAFAIQELLQIYKCDGSCTMKTQGGRLWKLFPQQTLEVVSPLLHSKYKNSSDKPPPIFTRPIFLSNFGKVFRSWITNWLIDLLPRINNSTAKKVFQACKMIMVHDVSISLYLLPKILVYVLLDGDGKDIADVRSEVLEVFNACHVSRLEKDAHKDQSEMRLLSAQVVFSCLDFLTKWIRKMQGTVSLSQDKVGSKRKMPSDEGNNSQIVPVKSFLVSIPKDLLAEASFFCQGYTRSLMHLEEFIQDGGKDKLQEKLNFMQAIYIALDEPDGVAGVAAMRKVEPEFRDQTAVYESIGRYQDALACYEQAVVSDPKNLQHHHGLLRCLLELDQPSIALSYVTGIITQQPDWSSNMCKYQVEAAWKLGQWDNLDKLLKCCNDSDHNWMVNVGQILLAAKNGDEGRIMKCLSIAKNNLMSPLSAASMEKGAYQRGYSSILKLHMLTDVEHSFKVFFDIGDNMSQSNSENLFKTWSARAEAVQSSLRFVEPLLKLHRAIMGLVLQNKKNVENYRQLKTEIGKCWLKSAKLARTNGHFQSAYSYLLDASKYDYDLSEVHTEKAEWLWSKGESEQAIITLQKGIDIFYPDVQVLEKSASKQKKKDCAKMKLLLTRYSEESASLDIETIVKMYRKVVELAPDCEDSHFYIGQAYDKILQTIELREQRWNYLICIIKHFGACLQYGSQHVYQSLPRFLSIWLDFGNELVDMEKKLKNVKGDLNTRELMRLKETVKKMKIVISNMNSIIVNYFPAKIPPYVLFTAFPQIISQICHPSPAVFQQLKEIIAILFVNYPQQAMWMIMAVSKSKFSIRADRCKEIFARVRELQPNLHKHVQDCSKFTDYLIELSNKETSKNSAPLSMNQHFKSMVRLVTDPNFSSIILPVQALMTVNLPSTLGPHPNHNPFVQNQVYVSGFEDKIDILASLQKPKKFTIRGSDGLLYDFMSKAKDDLRIDCRLMEFNGLVNKYLYHDPESRKRHLHIRTYCVTPINEDCGLIEWVNNLEGFRHILRKIYKEKKIQMNSAWILSKVSNKPEETLNTFRNVFLKHFPPVFNEWFLTSFPDPTAWYMAKLGSARTTAVMSMVGYILGLGDRHGENINYDSSCGDVVHVDFNCLFNKGETFNVPEKVPFRLTHNMVNAMGPLGVEGVFRKTCEVTLKVMREKKDTLMSVLKPFIYDPLVEWTKSKRSSRTMEENVEVLNKKAKNDVQNCEQRLRGIAKMKVHGIPLSVEGQVDLLIKEATDEKNLSMMYIGWSAYL